MSIQRYIVAILITVSCSFAFFVTTPVLASDGPIFMFDGKKMNGWIKNYGCRSPNWKPKWVAEYKDDKIIGHMLSSKKENDDPNLIGRPQYFELPVAVDGTFGATNGEGPHRLWLRWWASKSSGYGSASSGANKGKAHLYSGRKGKYHFVSGKVLPTGDIQLKLRWGTADNKGTCKGDAYFKIGKNSDVMIADWINANKSVCSGDAENFAEDVGNQIKAFRDDELVNTDYNKSKFALKKMYKNHCP